MEQTRFHAKTGPQRSWSGWLIASVLLAAILLSSCTVPLTPVAAARNQAEQQGCWPYGAYQPPTPTLVPTATPGLVGGNATPRPMPTLAPTVLAYPSCTPISGTPTITPTPIPQETPQSASALGGAAEVGATAGNNTNATLATDPGQKLTVVGWIAWGAGPDEYVGDVWVRVRNARDEWTVAQAINTAPVKKGAGGLGLAILPDGTIVVVYGAGGMNGDRNLYLVESRDAGQTWSLPTALPIRAGAQDDDAAASATPSATPAASDDAAGASGPITVGGVLVLQAAADGGLHLLYLARDPFRLGYAYRAPGQASWRVTDRVADGQQLRGALALLPMGNGAVRRLILAPEYESSMLRVLMSDDGLTWQARTLETGRFIHLEVITSLSLVAAYRPDGSALVAAAWGQYSKGGVFAAVSLDGGKTWGGEEPVALHQDGGDCYASDNTGLPCGYQPSLAYDPATDRLAVAWVEVLRGHDPLQRTRFSARLLDATGAWRYAVTPATRETANPPLLATWGQVGTLVGSRDHRAHWLLLWDTRNKQYRIYARPVNLAALLAEGVS
jgi:hypothetical protein